MRLSNFFLNAGVLLGIALSSTNTSLAALNATTDLPDFPLKGSINSISLQNIKASWANGILTLYIGKDPDFNYDTRLIIFFLLDKPANQTLNINTDRNYTSVAIHVDSKKHKDLDGVINSPIHIKLQSGTEKDYRVPVQMHLIAGNKVRVQLDGAFKLATSDLVAKDGVIDRSVDNLDTIAYIGKEYVKSQYPGKSIHFESPQLNWYSHGEQAAANGRGKLQVAGYSARFHVGDKPLQIAKLQIIKKNNKWQVVQELPADQMVAAHPLVSRYRDKLTIFFQRMAAVDFEQHFYKINGGWKKIKEPVALNCGGGRKQGQKGYCEVDYGLYYLGTFKVNGSYEQVKCTAKTYVFEQKSGKWSIEQVLPENKKFDMRQNKVVDRKGHIWAC